MQPADDATVARSPEETPTVVVSAAAPAELQHRQLTPGTIIGGRYRIVSMLGRGGMGEVYRADDLRMGQPVALKFLSARIASERQRLYDEVRMGRQVAHPNVCRLYDVSEIDGDAFITMEFVDGEDLASLIRRIGRLSATKAVGTAREIASGLAAAHEKGVVHRDLKPANVMIDDRGRARITDFGLAVAESVSGAHSVAGTPAYMAPEQLDGKAASFSSDVYALGLVLYEVFTGRRAFATDSITQLIESQRASRYARPTTLAPDLPPEIEPVIAHCLDPDPARRPTVDQVLRELPSFDALAVAVAAGEMPGPDLVAGASDRGTLSPAIAWSLLAFIVAGIVTCAVLSGSTMLYRRAVLKSPEVLADRARELIATVSRAPVADSSFGFIRDDSLLLFRYRQSPRAMRGRAAERVVLLDEPPMTVPGMARVDVDGAGRLLRLLVVPPSRESSPHLPAVNFERLLSAAEVHPIGGVAPLWTA
ncbi:MAG: serine/threonine protein kinase, partial [Acidobacteria bacterium]|nr:serine/threonine protein kinase [Acidobacteriota bacterium]